MFSLAQTPIDSFVFEIKKTFVFTKVKNKINLQSTLFVKVKLGKTPSTLPLSNPPPTARPAASPTSSFHHHRSHPSPSNHNYQPKISATEILQ